jgi:hypothetical protein
VELAENPDTPIIWSDYLHYRAESRRFDLAKIASIIRYSGERYLDTVTGRMVVVGKHDNHLVIIPYEQKGTAIIPVTIHATSRQQINFRLKTGRLTYA